VRDRLFTWSSGRSGSDIRSGSIVRKGALMIEDYIRPFLKVSWLDSRSHPFHFLLQRKTPSKDTPLLLRRHFKRGVLLTIIYARNAPLHSRPCSNPRNPFQQVWKFRHLLFSEVTLPSVKPRPTAKIRNAVLAFSLSSKEVTRYTCVASRKPGLENGVDLKSLCSEAVYGDWVLYCSQKRLLKL
jgi:hypothetical protein